MKLATYKDGSRDGQLLVVSRDLGTAHYATGIASKLQQVLDDWNFLSPQLQDLYDQLNSGRARHPSRSIPSSAWPRCRAPTSGPMARRTSTTSNWCEKRATPKCPKFSTPTR
jgi:hypothetical protein